MWAYLRNKRDVNSCVWLDEFDKNLSSNVSQKFWNIKLLYQVPLSGRKHIFQKHPICRLKSHCTLTLYVLSNERVIHYVTVICFQDFLKFSDVIVLVGAGREKHRVLRHSKI